MDLARLPLLGRLSARRRPLVGAVALLALVLLVGLSVLVATRGSARVPATVDQQRPGPVILVPGYGGSQASLTALADRLHAAGRNTAIVTLPGDGDGDLTEQADALDRVVGGALRDGAPSVDLVGYSAGGVVVRLWLARYPAARAVRRVVTLGSPLHGASIAGVGSAFVPGACPMACQQLVPGSSLLRQLDASALPAGLPWLSVWTRDDQTVTPPDSARLIGAVNTQVQDICPDAEVQHGQLPSDPLVTGLVLRALGTDALTAPAPADCAALRRLGRSQSTVD